MAESVADLVSQGEDVREPLSVPRRSIKFNLPFSDDLHRRLAIRAAKST